MDLIKLVERYYASVRARDIEAFMALFAEDAVFLLPNGREVAGAPAIREMELGAFRAGPPTPSPQIMLPGDKAIAVELQVALADGTVRRMSAFFHVNEAGLIQRLSVYQQG